MFSLRRAGVHMQNNYGGTLWVVIGTLKFA